MRRQQDKLRKKSNSSPPRSQSTAASQQIWRVCHQHEREPPEYLDARAAAAAVSLCPATAATRPVSAANGMRSPSSYRPNRPAMCHERGGE